jgi:uncharacterized protein YhbP (UPF0306 family)
MDANAVMPETMVSFLQTQHVLHLATAHENRPWVATCFYAFDPKAASFIVASDTKTRHLQEALENAHVAGSIALQTKEVGRIEGVQFEGVLEAANSKDKRHYFKAYPFALAMLPKLWRIHITSAKLTNNRLGFGHKEYFNRPPLPNQA